MRRTPRPEAEARLGERAVPIRLQPRLCCASLASTLASGSHARPRLPSTVPRPPGVRGWSSPRRLQSLGRGRFGLHPLHRGPSPALAVSSAAWLARDRRSTCHFRRSGLRRRALPPTMPSADFCAAVRSPYGDLSPKAETQRRPPEVRPTAFAARPPDLPPRPLMTMDFAINCSLVRPGRPRYPVLVHQAAALLHASFTPHLAVTPLRFANPSPSSGWIEDSHLQAVVHARHTANGPADLTGPLQFDRMI